MSTYRILIVEDSQTMRQLLSFALNRIRGVRIVEAADGLDALKKLSLEQFDLILTDVNMPLMDGLKLVSLIRNDPANSAVPIVVITTEAAQEDRERALALGANDYITKPMQPSKVYEVAKKLLNINEQ